MEALTVGQIVNFLGIIAGVIASVSAIVAVVHKLITKRINEELDKANDPIKQTLQEIKNQNEELKTQGDTTHKEIILIMKLNQSMISEMKTLGHINGETTKALDELNDYLINK